MVERLSQEDGEGRYEYKILRSYTNAFRSPERRRQILNEEARAGWEMVAKLDNARLIVRRLRTTQDSPIQGIDPYRTQVGTNLPAVLGALIAVIFLVGVVALVALLNGDIPANINLAVLTVMVVIGLITIVAGIAAKMGISR